MDGIRAQKIYEQNPEAQLLAKERLTQLNKIVMENKQECMYAHYLYLTMVEGYSIKEIAEMKGETCTEIARRINTVTAFLKTKVKDFK